jgi:hypothetical protein
MSMSAPHVTTPAAGELLAPAADGRWKTQTIAVASFTGALALNVLHVPGVTVSLWVPMFLLVTGCMAAMRWKRAGVRSELRNRAAAKMAKFGGGVYGAIAMATWLQLETVDLVGDVVGTGSVGGFVDSLSIGWLVSQAVESVIFGLRGALWPWHWFSSYGLQAMLMAAGAAWGLDVVLRMAVPRYRELRAAQKALQAAA